MNSNNENNRQHFASFMEEARYLMGKLKSDVKFCRKFFFTEDTKGYSIANIRNKIIKYIKVSYNYTMSALDFSTVIYEKLWDDGRWRPFNSYAGEKSFFSWLYKVTWHAISKYLEDIGEIRIRRERTPGNTRLTMKRKTPAECQYVISELMPKGRSRDLLCDIYVDRKSNEEIMEKYHLDSAQYKKAHKRAEDKLKLASLNSCSPFADYVLCDKSPRKVTVSSDFLCQIGDTYEDNSSSSAFGEVLGVNLTKSEVDARIEPFVSDFFHWKKWSDTDARIWRERKLYDTPPVVLANQLGRSRDWIDTRLYRVNERFREAFIGWYRVNA